MNFFMWELKSDVPQYNTAALSPNVTLSNGQNIVGWKTSFGHRLLSGSAFRGNEVSSFCLVIISFGQFQWGKSVTPHSGEIPGRSK
jgi:hypothetical protein